MLFIYLIILFSSSAYSSLVCDANGLTSSIIYLEGKERLKIVDLDFSRKGYLHSYLSCLSFLDRLGRDRKLKSEISYKALLTEYADRPIRLIGKEREKFYKTCLALNGCNISFPYRLLHWASLKNTLDWSKANPKVCDEKKREKVSREQLFLPIGNVLNWWRMPESSMSNEFRRVVQMIEPELIVISSMTISLSEIEFVDQYLKKNPNARAYLLFAFGLESFSPKFPGWMKTLSNRFFVLPVFQQPNAFRSFHMKGIALKGRQKEALIFSGSNFKRYGEEKIKDIGFTSTNPEVVESFLRAMKEVMRSSCSHPKAFDCSVNIRYQGTFESQILSQGYAQICNNQFEAKNGEDHMGMGPLRSTILEAILSAKESIEILSHATSDSEVARVLKDKMLQGVSVKIYIGQEDAVKGDFEALKSVIVTKRRAEIDVHTKLIIIDKKFALLGSANLTKFALGNPYENLFRISDPKSLEFLRSYFNSHYSR